MTEIDGPGYWRVSRGEGGRPLAELLSTAEGRRLEALGADDLVCVERDGRGGLTARQMSWSAMQLPNGQAIPPRVIVAIVPGQFGYTDDGPVAQSEHR